MLDPIQYEFWFLITTLADPEPGAGAETSIFRLQLPLRLQQESGSLRLQRWLHNTGPCYMTGKMAVKECPGGQKRRQRQIVATGRQQRSSFGWGESWRRRWHSEQTLPFSRTIMGKYFHYISQLNQIVKNWKCNKNSFCEKWMNFTMLSY
jgi:hypothetical protein